MRGRGGEPVSSCATASRRAPGSRTTCSGRPSPPRSRSRAGSRCTSASRTPSNTGTSAAPPCWRPTWPGTAPPRRPSRAGRERSDGPGRRPRPNAAGWPSARRPRTSPAPGTRWRTPGPATAARSWSTCSSRRRTRTPGQATPPAPARLLDDARQRATAVGDGQRLGRVGARACNGSARGSRCPATPSSRCWRRRSPRCAAPAPRWRPQLTAGLARELHHSVPEHRARARPLSEQAIALARRLDDPETLARLPARAPRRAVDAGPGSAAGRPSPGRSRSSPSAPRDPERHAEGLLLTANALLEEGSATFRSVLARYLHAAEQLRQPHHDYLAATRRGALALIDGRLDDAETLIDGASALGERIAEPDAGNVRMSQLLGLVRARREPAMLRATAADAVRWWVGVPSHANAVAAGLLVMAGDDADLDAARRALDTVVALDTWRTDRSYLWSVFVGAMTTAAIGLRDRHRVRPAARGARTRDRQLRRQRGTGLLHGQQRPLGGDARRRARPQGRRRALARAGPRRAPAARCPPVGGRDQGRS